ncbi:MAG: hypothetical protein K0U36_02695, partial [Alphaproteobacteria bacterium]|nr:hypothetical protein [Alphaproteobacteria bacterium]
MAADPYQGEATLTVTIDVRDDVQPISFAFDRDAFYGLSSSQTKNGILLGNLVDNRQGHEIISLEGRYFGPFVLPGQAANSPLSQTALENLQYIYADNDPETSRLISDDFGYAGQYYVTITVEDPVLFAK